MKIINGIDIEKHLDKDIKYIESDLITRSFKKKYEKGNKKYDYIKFCKPLNAVAAINITKQQYINYWKTKYKDYPDALIIILKAIKKKFEDGLTPTDEMIKLIENSKDDEKEKKNALKVLLRKENNEMEEKCFIVEKNSNIYNEYFDWWNNRDNLLNKWNQFKKLVGIESETFVPNQTLYIVPTENDLNKFGKMFCTEVFKDGLRKFKTNSLVQKDWKKFIDNNKVLVSKPDIILDFISKACSCGKITSRLFHYKNNVYASICGDFYKNFEIPKGYKEIKKSKFYEIVEKIEEEQKKNEC